MTVKFDRVFTPLCSTGVDVFDLFEWTRRDARLVGTKGVVFEQKGVEAPAHWSQTAVNVVASKYFRGQQGTPERETSVKQLVGRVVKTITLWGTSQGYFQSDEDAAVFRDELTYAILAQYGTFNSPVWFNVGVPGAKQQASACFVNSVEDSMDSIMDLARTEAMIFKSGSGSGVNLSRIRSKLEGLSGGGIASGPVSFMRGFDAFSGVIKSGGRTRRAARLVLLDIDHPDILEFIRCKAEEERKAWALIDAGYDGSMDGEAYGSVFHQNANNSVRVSDFFMEAALHNEFWTTHARTTGKPLGEHQADKLLSEIAQATHQCGDPGLQFSSTVNMWNTCKKSGEISASNPCMEVLFLNDTACNLASLNLLEFLSDDGEFKVEAFKHAVDVFITAQDIMVAVADYPTEQIKKNSCRFRPLGLGYSNLGATLMVLGLPYDSDEGRAYAAAVTAIMTGEAYLQSARLSKALGAFEEFTKNRDPMLQVIDRHRTATERLDLAPAILHTEAADVWRDAERYGEEFGFRNAQVTVLAPAGTISFMLDCATTGVEPEVALVKYKALVGGGTLKLASPIVARALRGLGYMPDEILRIEEYISEHGTVEDAPDFDPGHNPIFDCAMATTQDGRVISPDGHIKMLASVQPFISGGISKTVNVPEKTTADEIKRMYIKAWRLGLKAVSIYRDNSKRLQPITTGKERERGLPTPSAAPAQAKPYRKRLPDERNSITHKFSIANLDGYLITGLYEDGTPGEIFVNIAKSGSVVNGLLDGLALAVSLCLQYGVPLDVLVEKYSHTRFEPSGFTTNPKIPMAKSLTDYIFRWLGMKFLESDGGHAETPTCVPTISDRASTTPDASSCSDCGGLLVRSGTCYRCENCGSTTGCS
jgi:ribonucleoside-diphosphate reductase alpha chain